MLPLLLSATLLAPAADPDPAVTPKGTPPTILVGTIDKNGNLVTVVMRPEAVTVTRQVKENVNGKEVVRQIAVTEMRMTKAEVTRDLSKATVTTASGKKIDKKELAKRLAKPAAVLISADGKAVDKGFLALFKADTLVIVLPAPKAEELPTKD
jgi:hypothetical protein